MSPSEQPVGFILAPYAEEFRSVAPRPAAPRIADLRDRGVILLDNRFSSLAIIHDELRAHLRTLGVEPATIRKRSYGAPLEPSRLAELGETVDVVVSGLCDTPPSTTWGVRDSIALELASVVTVTLVTARYEDLLIEIASAEGMPDLPSVVLPYPLEGLPEPEVRAIARAAVGPLIAALTDPTAPPRARVEP